MCVNLQLTLHIAGVIFYPAFFLSENQIINTTINQAAKNILANY
jgi:hypothetical protein